MSPKIGDIVCWSDHMSVLGHICSIKWYEKAGYVYVVEWHTDKLDESSGLYRYTFHTLSGICSMRESLEYHLNKSD